MERAVTAAVLVALAVVVAVLIDRRSRSDAPTQARWVVPSQLDRDDFDRPTAPWLVAVFTSATCRTCAGATAAARAVEGGDVVVQEVEAGGRRDLHDRYGIDAVPTLVVADAEGVVRASYVGVPPDGDLATALADLRAGRPVSESAVVPPTRRRPPAT